MGRALRETICCIRSIPSHYISYDAICTVDNAVDYSDTAIDLTAARVYKEHGPRDLGTSVAEGHRATHECGGRE